MRGNPECITTALARLQNWEFSTQVARSAHYQPEVLQSRTFLTAEGGTPFAHQGTARAQLHGQHAPSDLGEGLPWKLLRSAGWK